MARFLGVVQYLFDDRTGYNKVRSVFLDALPTRKF